MTGTSAVMFTAAAATVQAPRVRLINEGEVFMVSALENLRGMMF